jgi:hypothetical protein
MIPAGKMFKIMYVPKISFLALLHEECFVAKRRHMEVAAGGENLSLRLKEFFRMQKSLQHSLVQQHVAHRFGDDRVHLFRKANLFDLSRNHRYFIRAVVRFDERLNKRMAIFFVFEITKIFQTRGNHRESRLLDITCTLAPKSIRTIATFVLFFLYLLSYKPDQAKISTCYRVDPWLITAEI